MATPEMVRVRSSSVQSVGYDADHHRLYIRYAGGGLYVYDLVPPHVYRELLAAESLGRYVNARVRTRYPYRLL